MGTLTDTLRLLGDTTRLRILHLLASDELAVGELQVILGMKQSRISTQLAQLKSVGLVEVRRRGKNSLYGLAEPLDGPRERLMGLVGDAAAEILEVRGDRKALALVLRKRSDLARQYFDQLAGKFGRTYCPGRSWKGLAETLLKLMPPLVIADLGAGEGTFSQLLAQRAERVIAVDRSEKMVAFGSRVAKENGYTNLEYRLGDIESPPIDEASVDLAFFSQALHHASQPEEAIRAAFRIVRPGGRVVVLDLLTHEFEDARELYADVWLGFSEVEMADMLEGAGWEDVSTAVVDREADPPHFETLLALATKRPDRKRAIR
ncbi:metalloregulator ArsR/SmtB family transcription factor [soil metagenome]